MQRPSRCPAPGCCCPLECSRLVAANRGGRHRHRCRPGKTRSQTSRKPQRVPQWVRQGRNHTPLCCSKGLVPRQSAWRHRKIRLLPLEVAVQDTSGRESNRLFLCRMKNMGSHDVAVVAAALVAAAVAADAAAAAAAADAVDVDEVDVAVEAAVAAVVVVVVVVAVEADVVVDVNAVNAGDAVNVVDVADAVYAVD